MSKKPHTLEAAIHLLADDVIHKVGGNAVLEDMERKCQAAIKSINEALKVLKPMARNPTHSVGPTAIRDLTTARIALQNLVADHAPYVWSVIDPSGNG